MTNNEPIKSQQEFDKVLYGYLIPTAMHTLGITKKQAELRVNALRKSGLLLKMGDPDDMPFKIMIDVAMQIPQVEAEK